MPATAPPSKMCLVKITAMEDSEVVMVDAA